MKKIVFVFLALFLSLPLGIFANLCEQNESITYSNGGKATVIFEIESIEHLQELLPQIEQEILNCHFVKIIIVNSLTVDGEQFAVLQDFGKILIQYKNRILLLWQGNYVCPAHNGIALSHYEWWRWTHVTLGVNPANSAKWQIESVELDLFVNDGLPETIFEVVTSPYEDPAYMEQIAIQLECQGFPRPRDSYNYPVYSISEGYEILEIPENILETISTQAIAQAVWEYPFTKFLLTGRNYLRNLNTWNISNTNANKALIERADGATAFLYRLLMFDPVPGLTLPAEVIMCQMELLDQLDDGQKKQLIRTTIVSDSLRREYGGIVANGVISWLLIGRTLISSDYPPFMEFAETIGLSVWFLNTYLYDQLLPETLRLTIKEYAEAYLKEKMTCCENAKNLKSEKCNDNCVQLSWHKPESSVPIAGYEVYRNDQLLTDPLSTVTSYSDTNLPDGIYEYYVITHYTDSCVSDRSNLVTEKINVVGITDVIEITGSLIFPNPVKDKLYLSKEKQFEIYDMQGKVLLRGEKTTQTIDVSHLKPGIYFIKFEDNSVEKFVKE